MKIQHYLVRLYPHVWRERYEDELLAMLEQRSLSFTDGANLFFSVLSMPIFHSFGMNWCGE